MFCLLKVRHAVHVHALHSWTLRPCLHHYNCLLFIIIPPVTDVHVMLKKIECESRVWSTKRSQRKTERHLNLAIKKIDKICKPPLIISRMK